MTRPKCIIGTSYPTVCRHLHFGSIKFHKFRILAMCMPYFLHSAPAYRVSDGTTHGHKDDLQGCHEEARGFRWFPRGCGEGVAGEGSREVFP